MFFRLLLAAALLCPLAFPQDARRQRQTARAHTYDILIKNGRVIDGAGNPWFFADVALRKGEIARIGRPGEITGTARRTIDAAGMVVAPGFIDMHSHSDLPLLYDGDAQSKVRMGVTTEILGEAGSIAPRCPEREDGTEVVILPQVKRDWLTLRDYFSRLKRQGVSVNVASYVGSGTVRMCAMGSTKREPTPAELEDMRARVDQAMLEGAIGLSTGLIYPPASFATTAELVELAKVAAKHGGMYTAHMRNEGARIFEAVQETVTIAEQAKLPAHIFHFKIANIRFWGRMAEVSAAIDQARAKGVEITADVYPYIASSTGLSARLPEWVQEGGNAAMLNRLRDGATRQRLKEEFSRQPYDWTKAVVARVRRPENKPYEGKSIAEIAQYLKKEPPDTVFDLLLSESGTVGMVYFGMTEEDIKVALRQPWVSVGSDGSAFKTTGVLGEGKPHPRSYGTFARILQKYVREEKAISLEEAIRKMTSLPASQMGIFDRGLLREGMRADVLVFDPEKIAERTTFQDPHQYSEGMQYVVVNGEVVLNDGEHTGARPGEIIYGPGYKPGGRGARRQVTRE